MSSAIRRLSRDLINKIAAGEVVERPASVIKELVENSLDAGASRVEITIEDGGKKLIRVSDDGKGMSPDDLPMAFESHATSKLAEADDLFRIGTLGFRGEALASIGEISHARAVSRQRGAPEGYEVECDAGRIGDVRARGAPEGTMIEVRDLFFNTPARLKFLRSTATELRHIVEMINRLALPHPAVAFQLTHNGRQALSLKGCASLRERLAELFGQELCEHLLPVRNETSALTVSGFISPPGEGAATSMQYFFLNGRYVRDRALGRAAAEAYRSRMMRGKFPAVFLELRMDPARVDVNVHPTKIEVRFRDSGAVFAQTLTAMERALRAAGPVAQPPPEEASAGTPAQITPRERQADVRQAIADFFQGPARREFVSPPTSPLGAHGNAHAPVDSVVGASGRTPEQTLSARPELEAASAPSAVAQSSAPAQALSAQIRNISQIHDSYIVEEVSGGFLVIDQHALHERILYEELRRRAKVEAVPRQKLLIPEIVELRPDQFALADESREALLKMGLEIEPFGEKTMAVQAVPHLAGRVHPRELLTEALDELAKEHAGVNDREELLMRVIACKAAIKAGDKLSRARIEALLDRRDRIGPEPTCPHGRPTTLRFDLSELEKRFKRT